MSGSFRTYLDDLVAEGEATPIEEAVSWNLEASAITMLANRADDRVPVFESVEHDGVDARLVGDPYRGPHDRPWDRIGSALGLSSLSGPAYYEAVCDRLGDPVDPVVVDRDGAACKEVVREGADADLLGFPWPYLHQGDGGRYSNLHTIVVPDPHSEWETWSYHRMMVHDNDQASLLLLAGELVPNRYYFEYERRDEPMPIAVAIGADPAVEATSVMWIPVGHAGAEYAGSLARSPVELVPCETNDLHVPASAELVIEGRVLPNARLDEGPFGDYFGFVNGPRRSMPVLEVDAITHRERPYLPFSVEGTGVEYGENSTSSLQVACAGPDATVGLRAMGFDVEMAAPWAFTARTVYTISTEVPYPGYLHELANFIFTTWGMLHIDFFVFVDPDVNPLDQRAVLEALALYADPEADFHQFGVETMPKVPLNIYQTPDEKGSARVGTSKAKTAKGYIDATRPAEEARRTEITDEELRRRARETLADAGVDLDATDPPAGTVRRR